MPSLSQHIAKRAAELPEGSLLCPRALLHLGNRAAVDQALSRLARRGQLMRDLSGHLCPAYRDSLRSAPARS